MTRYEAAVLMATLRAAYPQYYARQTAEDSESAVALWAMMFEDDRAEEVAAAVKAFIATDVKGLPPSIGQIKAKLDTLRAEASGGELTAQEAWTLVQKAVRRSYYNAQEEFDKLPDTVRAVVGGPSMLRDWSVMDVETLSSVVSSNFQRGYTARAAHVTEMRKLPGSVKAFIASPEFKKLGAFPEENAMIDDNKRKGETNCESI